jgi:tetratricopeptide (TPR) repeat protein
LNLNLNLNLNLLVPPNRLKWLLALAIAIAAWLLYSPTLTADFVWDARAKILMSDFIHDPANLPGVLTGRVLTRDVLDNNRPANLLSLMMDAAFWGRRPAGYHATSITLHAAVCAMLFLLLLRLLPTPGALGPAFVAALVFAVHPLNCEAVSEVSYREDLLVAASLLVSLFAAMAFLRHPGRLRNLLLGSLCCLALLFGVAAKENGVAGPFVLACYWLLWRRKDPRLPWAALLAAASIAVFGFLLARFTLRPEHSVIYTAPPARLGGSLANSLLAQLRIYAMQFSQVILPHDLCADYGPWSLRNYSIPLSALALALVIAAQLFLAFRDRLFALGSVLFWAGLLPVSNIVPIFRPMADRFLYVPLLGLALLLAQALYLARHLRLSARAPLYGLLILWITVAAFLTCRREAVWHNSLTLWQDTVLRDPYSFTAANNFGWALLAAQRNRDAATFFERAIQLSNSTDPDPWAGIALVCQAIGNPAAATTAFHRAVSLDPRYAHPQDLVRALTAEPDVAAKLDLLAHPSSP